MLAHATIAAMDAPAVHYVKTTDGYDIAYYARGNGLTLIRTPVLWNNISRQWHPSLLGAAFDALTERFRLILYDARGQGLSTRGLPEALSVDEYLLDLEGVADQAGGDRFILSGWSFMGVVAIKYAVQHPDRVSALVLWDYVGMHASASWPTMTDLARRGWRLYVEQLRFVCGARGQPNQRLWARDKRRSLPGDPNGSLRMRCGD